MNGKWIIHVNRRAMQRLGFRLSKDQQCELVKKIQNGESEMVKRHLGSQSKWGEKRWHDVNLNGEWIRCLYDKKRHVIRTVISPYAKVFEIGGAHG